MSGEQLLTQYETNITSDIGLEAFAQFVFLQHFLFTFDESRHLLLWDQAVLTQVLYLCIGADYSTAQEADSLNRKKEKAASLARNASWRASQIKNEITIIEKNLGLKDEDIKSNERIKEQYNSFSDEFEISSKRVLDKQKQVEDLNFKAIEKNAELSHLMSEYNKEFEIAFNNRSRVHYHPLIAASFSEQKCALCNSIEKNVTDNIKVKIDAQVCPLCSNSIESQSQSNDEPDILKSIDVKINLLKNDISSTSQSIERLTNELQASINQRDKNFAVISEFEKQNEQFILNHKNKKEVRAREVFNYTTSKNASIKLN